MNKFIIGAALLLSACGLTEESFAEKSCEAGNDCMQQAIDAELGLTADDLVDCANLETAEIPDGWTCTFDAKQAATCLSAMSGADCSTLDAMIAAGEAMADDCEDVTVCTEDGATDDTDMEDTDAS